jgi:hydrogenase-4 component F
MRLVALVALPALVGLLAYLPAAAPWRAAALVATAAVHAVLAVSLWVTPAGAALGGWLAADALGTVILTAVSILFVVVAGYSIGYLRRDRPGGSRVFIAGLLGFLAGATLVTLSHHLALLWIGMEATTLAIAPLIVHRRDRRSLEAVWKYLVISSVGIALALFGIFLLATAQPVRAGQPLILEDLLTHAGRLDPSWLRAAFVFLLIGFGTKMGLAPLHTWKPDTYGEAPPLVAGLMAGGLTSCAFLGIARITQVAFAADLGPFVRPLLLVFGLASLVVAAAFVIGQTDVKRLLAYSSVEHTGLLVLGLAFGGAGAYGTVLHVVNNAFAKGLLFLAVGNVVLAGGTALVTGSGQGMLRRVPVSGALLLVGLFAITASPPFGMFVSVFTIVHAAFDAGYTWTALAILFLLAVIFVGIARLLLELLFGAASQAAPERERSLLVVGPAVLAVLVLLLGVYVPGPLGEMLGQAAVMLGGGRP